MHDLPTKARVERELRVHVYPVIGERTLSELAQRPSIVQAWVNGIKLNPRSSATVTGMVSGIFLAAIDDGLIGRNPLQLRTVRRPTVVKRRPQPWTLEQVEAVSAAMQERYRILPYLGVGLGLRQGEVFGLAVDDIDFLRRTVRVCRQVRSVNQRLIYAEIKNKNVRDIPLPDSLGARLAEHIRLHPPVKVTLPWQTPDGEPVSHRLLLSKPNGNALDRNTFRQRVWRPALIEAGMEMGRYINGCHTLRHTAASAWLAAGIDIATVAGYLGDSLHTVVDTYAHMMPDARTERGGRWRPSS